jgi:hypothetical protein
LKKAYVQNIDDKDEYEVMGGYRFCRYKTEVFMKALLFFFITTNVFAFEWSYKIESDRYPLAKDKKALTDARKEWFFGKVTCSVSPTDKDEFSEVRILLCQIKNVYFSTTITCLKQENVVREGNLHFYSETTKDAEIKVECKPD